MELSFKSFLPTLYSCWKRPNYSKDADFVTEGNLFTKSTESSTHIYHYPDSISEKINVSVEFLYVCVFFFLVGCFFCCWFGLWFLLLFCFCFVGLVWSFFNSWDYLLWEANDEHASNFKSFPVMTTLAYLLDN